MEGLLSAARRSRPPREELRFGTVLNGGVSLAVWMSGATVELLRIARESGPYGEILDALDATASIDVITGW